MLFMTANRIPIIDYFCVQSPGNVKFLFRQPALSTVSNIYIMPFTNSVWCSVALLVFVCSVAIFMTIVVTSRESKGQSTSVDGEDNRFTDVLLMAIGAVCQMGSHFEPKLVSGRISSVIRRITLILFDYKQCFFSVIPLCRFSFFVHLVHGEYCSSATVHHKQYSFIARYVEFTL
jgi:hypothetical protein